MQNRSILAAAGLAAGLAFCGTALAQDGAPAKEDPMARPIPEGFVLPGPPPTNAPAATPDAAAPNPDPMARPIPEDFVLPGPPPANAPAPSAAAPATPAAPAAGEDAASARPMDFARQTAEGAGDDWPCVQRKIEAVSPAQVWRGPPFDTAAEVELTPAMLDVVDELAARRLPLDEAEQRIVEFAESLPEEERARTATALFAELLDQLNAERAEIIDGIERYARRQKALAEKLRADNSAFDALLDKPDVSAMEVEEARQALLWNTRIFDERRLSLTYVCEVPTLIEQRLFGLGRALSQAL